MSKNSDQPTEGGRDVSRPYGSVHRGQYDEMAAAAIAIARAYGEPDNWSPFIYESAINGVIVTGAPCPPVTRGKNKGEPNLREYDRNRVTKVFLFRQWEKR